MRAINRVIEIVGSQDAVANACQVSQGAVSQWARGLTAINARHYATLAQLSNGELTPGDFLDDEMKRLEERKKAS